jgi:hypothetical protein
VEPIKKYHFKVRLLEPKPQIIDLGESDSERNTLAFYDAELIVSA